MSDAVTTTDTVTARARAYELLGALLLDGPTGALRAYVGEIDELARLLAGDDDEAAVEHHRVMVLEVFPFESVFLGAEAQVGGQITDAVFDAYAAAGWEVEATGASADHIGHELTFMGQLTRRGDHEAARGFLDSHLLPWLPALSFAVTAQHSPFYAAVVELALEAALEHRAWLEVDAGLASASPVAPIPHDLTGILDDPRTGLKRLARVLLVPAKAGLFLSGGDVTRIANSLELPRGFGSRVKMLESLLFTAVEHDRVRPLVRRLQAQVDLWASRWGMTALRLPAPLRPVAGGWTRTLAQTRAVLEQLADAALAPQASEAVAS